MRLKIHIFYVLCFILLSFISCSRQPVYPEPSSVDSKIVIDVRIFKSELPEFFTYHYNNKNINFFVVKINNEVLSFFDACAKCYPQRLGYSAHRGHVICRACNIRYPLEGLKTGIGSCYPIILNGRLEGEKYLIDKEAVIAGSKYF